MVPPKAEGDCCFYNWEIAEGSPFVKRVGLNICDTPMLKTVTWFRHK